MDSPAAVRSSPAGGSHVIQTPAAALDLGIQSLGFGTYQVSVVAVDGAGKRSDPAATAVTLAGADLSGVRVRPNPWRAARGDTSITFDGMPPNSSVKIFTVSGRWVTTLSVPNGSVAWNLTNDGGDRVASGLYLFIVSDDQGRKTRGKFSIIR